MRDYPSHRRSERGSVLFLILLAVVLFAALSYAVTSSMRGGGKDASSENARAAASDILNRATLYENELNRFILTRGYNLSDFDLSSSSIISASGVVATRLPLNYSDPAFTFYYPSYVSAGGVSWALNKQRVTNVGTDLPDIILVAYGIKTSICQAINTMMGTGSSSGQYLGLTTDALVSGTMSPPNAARTWCLIQNNIYGPYFHHVVVAR